VRELSLFTGMGGGIYGSLILGWKTIAYVEQDERCRKVIKQRIADGWFDAGEIYGKIEEFNKKDACKYTGKVDVLTGGFPCQPFSVAGKGEGTSDERYLFDEIIKTIKIIQPGRLLFENVPGILNHNAIIEIYQALSKIGYRPKRPLLLGSNDCDNIHKRQRVWIFADSEEFRWRRRSVQERGDEWSVSKQIERQERALWSETSGCAVREVHATNPTSERCDHRQNHRQERQVCDAEIGKLSEIQSERTQCIGEIDSTANVLPTLAEQCRRPEVLCNQRTAGDQQTEEGATTKPHSQTDSVAQGVSGTAKIHHTNNSSKRGEGVSEESLPGKYLLSRIQSIRGIEDIINRPDIPEPLLWGVDDELPDWKQQLKAIGNGQDPIVMATAWGLLNN